MFIISHKTESLSSLLHTIWLPEIEKDAIKMFMPFYYTRIVNASGEEKIALIGNYGHFIFSLG